jgi:hypothetical protein
LFYWHNSPTISFIVFLGMGCISIDQDEATKKVILHRAARTFLYCSFLEENGRILYSRAEILPVRDNDVKDVGIVENGELKIVLGELRGRNVRSQAALGVFTNEAFDFYESVCWK